MFKGTIEPDGGITAVADTANFVYFDLYIKLDSDKKLSLGAGSKVEEVVAEGETARNTHLASRVSFADLGNITSGIPTEALALGSDFDGSAVIWEPNATSHIAENSNNGMQATVQAYDGVKAALANSSSTLIKSGDDGYEAAAAETKYDTYFAPVTTKTEDGFELLDLEKGINKVRVYVWLEGQDVDCKNAISAGTFSVDFKLTVPSAQENA